MLPTIPNGEDAWNPSRSMLLQASRWVQCALMVQATLQFHDLGTVPYRQAWALQESAHAEVLAGGAERVLLVEHPPVITFGRRTEIERNLITPEAELNRLGVEVVPSD